jgi:hypothetical protein
VPQKLPGVTDEKFWNLYILALTANLRRRLDLARSQSMGVNDTVSDALSWTLMEYKLAAQSWITFLKEVQPLQVLSCHSQRLNANKRCTRNHHGRLGTDICGGSRLNGWVCFP